MGRRPGTPHSDIPLDDTGREQAQRLVEAFRDRPVCRIISSDLQRAWMTATPVAEAHGLEIEQRRELRERGFGDWEGQPFEVIAQRFIELELKTGAPREELRPPGGESQQDVWDRLEVIAEEIETFHEPTLVVTHGMACSLLLARILRGSPFTSRSFRFDNTGITTVARRPDAGFYLLDYNNASHLREPALTGSIDGTSRR
jgi:broad specificity phosphatase PhoE